MQFRLNLFAFVFTFTQFNACLQVMLALMLSASRSLLNKIRALRANGHTICDKHILQTTILEISIGMVRAEDQVQHGARLIGIVDCWLHANTYTHTNTTIYSNIRTSCRHVGYAAGNGSFGVLDDWSCPINADRTGGSGGPCMDVFEE